MNIFQQAAALVSDSPGSLVYYLVLLFALGAAAAVAFSQWRSARPAPDAARGRLALSAGLLFGLHLLALLLALLAAVGILDALVVVPPFERAVSTFTITIVIWFLAFPQPLRLADAVFGLVSILLILGLAISWGLWYQQAPLLHYYNGSLQETVWEDVQLLLLVAGAILIALRRRSDWGLGLVSLALLFAAHLIHYYYPIGFSNVSGTERLFEIVVVPLIAATILRRALRPLPAAPVSAGQAATPVEANPPLTQPVAPPSAEPRSPVGADAAVALASLGTAADLPTLAQAALVGVADLLPAPIAFCLTPAEAALKVLCVYDRHQQHCLDLPMPMLDNGPALEPLLSGDSPAQWVLTDKEAQLRAVAFEAGLQTDGPVLLMPVRLPGGALLGAIGALPAPGQAAWSDSQQALLKALALPIAQAWQAVLGRQQPAIDAEALTAQRDAALQQAEALRQSSQAQADRLQRLERDALAHTEQLAELETLRAHLQSLGPDIDQARQREQALQAELELLKAQPAPSVATSPAAEAAPAADETAPKSVPAEPDPTAASETEALRTTLAILQPELEYYRQQEQQLLQQLEQMKTQLAARPVPEPAPELDTLRANLQALAAEIDAYRAEQARLEAENERYRQEAVQLQAELDQGRAAVSAQPVDPAHEAQLAELNAHVRQLETIQAEAEARRCEMDSQQAQAAAQLSDLQRQLAASQQTQQRLADELAARAALPQPEIAAKPSNGFIDPDQGLAEMLEALAGAETRLADQKQQIAELQQALANSELQRRAPAPVARPLQAADMEVIASLAQELRQPMSSIIGYADLLLSESVGIIGALQRKFLERIKASSERTGVLLDDLMRVMDIDSGNLNLAQETVNVVQVIDDALRGCQNQFGEKNVRLVTDIPPNLPPVQADRDALLQIFSHLLNNSGAASANDTEVHLSVRHETEQRPGADPLNYLIISVTDTGGGIAPEDQPRVFSRLYRADAPLIAGLGDNGMGLAIAKALVEGHGGRIWVISDSGGSTFYVLLPLEGKYAKADGARR